MPRSLRSLFGRLTSVDRDRIADADLVARFAKDRDQAAFELLVWRHGNLVLGTCRRILGDEHLAEDAFQATFLVLARKAGSVISRNVAGWLHRVARRVSVRAAKKRAKVSVRELAYTMEPAGMATMPDRDRATLLDAEVGRLPDRFRLPVLLCYLQDYTTDEAARVLGIPRGTVLSRLSTARQRLSARLTKRGVTLPATLVSATVVSNPLVSATVRSAAPFAVGEAALTTAPTLLATEVLRMTAWKLPAAVAASFALLAGLGTGVGVLATAGPNQDGQPVAQTKPADPPKPQAAAPADNDPQRKAKREAALDLMMKQEATVWEKMREVERQRQAAAKDMGEDVDLKVLLASLETIDSRILVAEIQITTAESGLKNAKEKMTNPEKTLRQSDVDNVASGYQSVRLAYDKVQLWNRKVADLTTSTTKESSVVKAAEKELSNATNVYQEELKTAKAVVEKSLLESHRKDLETALRSAETRYADAVHNLETQKKRRGEMVRRIARARQNDNANQLLEDEMRVYREFRQSLLRQRLLLQLDLDGGVIPAPAGGINDGRIEQLLRDVADLKSEVRHMADSKPPTTQPLPGGRGTTGRGGRGDQ